MKNKVSIVVPVYNAEDFLGYCLNSIFCQSYSNFEVIIINDGSTDKSLEICNNYAKLDKRFLVKTIKNGGVSNARNTGIKLATGKYLTFIDSDDVVSPYYIEKLVAAAEQYQTELVISDFRMVNFNDPTNYFVLSGKNYSPKTPLVLSKDDFIKNMMEIIWKTSLIESGCGKLFNLKIWRSHKIKLDSNLSLGEDFMANLEYYKYAKGAVFLNEALYYYNNIDDSDSLSHKYRKDLFENKMYLAEELNKWLDFEKLSKKSKEYYYNYVTSYGFVGIESLLKASKYFNQREKEKQLQTIIAYPLFRQSVENATYFKYPEWKELILKQDIRHLANYKIDDEKRPLKGSFINKNARRIVRFYYTRIKHNPTRFKKLDYEIANTGVKNTLHNNLKH